MPSALAFWPTPAPWAEALPSTVALPSDTPAWPSMMALAMPETLPPDFPWETTSPVTTSGPPMTTAPAEAFMFRKACAPPE